MQHRQGIVFNVCDERVQCSSAHKVVASNEMIKKENTVMQIIDTNY